MPNPNPYLERTKKLLVYDPACHDYSTDKPVWTEILPDHFVYGNTKEIEEYRNEIDRADIENARAEDEE